MDKDRFLSFIETGIGLPEDNLVRLIPHNTNWAKVFADEAIRIHNALKINSLKLHHGGSTAIPHIVAKPIIDIIGEIDHLEELDNNKEALEKIGYEYKGEYGIKNRRYSVLYNLKKSIAYCHLHVFKTNSQELADHLIFKNYLILKPHRAKKYEDLKKSLNIPRSEYSKAKSYLIAEILEEAKKES